MSTILWLRNDLRVEDHPALSHAVQSGDAVIPVFIWSPEQSGDWPAGAASRWWLHASLEQLGTRLERLGSRLILRSGPADQVLVELAQTTGATRVVWNRRYEPAHVAADRQTWAALEGVGLEVASFDGALLFDPRDVRNKQGEPYRVFTPFWRFLQASSDPGARLPAPARMTAPETWPESVDLDTFGLLPRIDWAGGLRDSWTPGEAGALDQLERFLDEGIAEYAEGRDRPDHAGTSRLSPHLHFGEIAPRRIWREVRQRIGGRGEPYLRQLAWREFAHHLLFHFPATPTEPLRPEFARFPWRRDDQARARWSKGETGYPFVDAGMRELWHTGWMHNRVRMIVASFLVKDLLLPWQDGARWFWDTLVDADLANNTLGWQWTAGCGADAAPYFRVFNPVTQGRKFDPRGTYVRRWVPELRDVPDTWVHEPWTIPRDEGRRIGFVLGETYPAPMVDHATARDRALAAYDTVKSSKQKPKGDPRKGRQR